MRKTAVEGLARDLVASLPKGEGGPGVVYPLCEKEARQAVMRKVARRGACQRIE